MRRERDRRSSDERAADLRNRAWWEAADHNRNLGWDVLVFDPESEAHLTEWDRRMDHGNITVVPKTGARTWHMLISGPVPESELEPDEDSIDDAPFQPVRF